MGKIGRRERNVTELNLHWPLLSLFSQREPRTVAGTEESAAEEDDTIVMKALEKSEMRNKRLFCPVAKPRFIEISSPLFRALPSSQPLGPVARE